jgi:hypothetical protein
VKLISLALAATAPLAAAAAAAPSTTGLWPHVYSTTISGSASAALNATWRISIRRSTFATTRNGAVAASGSVVIAGNRITFHDLGGPLACKGAQAVGRYAWHLNGARLTFTRLADPCPGRRTILARAFTRFR